MATKKKAGAKKKATGYTGGKTSAKKTVAKKAKAKKAK